MSISKRRRSCARAPVRADPAGGGTDAPPFCRDHGGYVLNFTVQRHMWASAERLADGTGVMIYAADQDRGIVADSVSALSNHRELEFPRAFVRRLAAPDDSLLLVTGGDVPPGSGLGGSGALGVAMVSALDRAYGRTRSRQDTAELANEIERGDLGYAGGNQDSFGPAFGGVNLIECRTDGNTVVHSVEIAADVRRAIEYNSLLVYTGAAHVSGRIHEDILRNYADEQSPTKQALWNLRRSAVTMAEALTAGDLRQYAALLNVSCDSLYALHDSCDSPVLRKYSDVLDEVILGRKTCGAGGGGFMLVYAKPGMRFECMRRVEELGGSSYPVVLDLEGVQCHEEPALSLDDVERLRCKILAATP